ncbi:MAG: glycosidase, partial [Thiohalocapsa sp.]|nr:glycosidase [Thiohalocapsa sp.]
VRDQLTLIRLRNTSPAFRGALTVADTDDRRLELTWRNGSDTATLHADLVDCGFEVITQQADGTEQRLAFG